jgi:hypothetical protein
MRSLLIPLALLGVFLFMQGFAGCDVVGHHAHAHVSTTREVWIRTTTEKDINP